MIQAQISILRKKDDTFNISRSVLHSSRGTGLHGEVVQQRAGMTTPRANLTNSPKHVETMERRSLQIHMTK